jgi:hypothetical protein
MASQAEALQQLVSFFHVNEAPAARVRAAPVAHPPHAASALQPRLPPPARRPGASANGAKNGVAADSAGPPASGNGAAHGDGGFTRF